MLIRLLSTITPKFTRSFKRPPIPSIPTSQQPQSFNKSSTTNQIPEEVINKTRRLKQEMLQQQVKDMIKKGMKQQEIVGLYARKQPRTMQETQQNIELVKQEMLLNDIMKQYKNKKQIPIGNKYQSNTLTPQQQHHKQISTLQKVQRQIDQTKNYSQLTFDDQLNLNYPSALIKKAEAKKTQELAYFKSLMHEPLQKQHQKQQSSHFFHRRPRKGQSYKELKERIIKENQDRNKQRKTISEYNNYLIDMQESYKKQRKHSNDKNMKDVVEYQDEKYYKQKALKQFQIRSKGQQDDILLMQAGQHDLQQSSDIRTFLIDQYEDQQNDSDYKKQIYESSSFATYDRKMIDLQNRLKKYGVNVGIEELQHMKKDMLFAQKKLREEQLEYQKYLLKKDKKKKMDLYMKRIHSEKLKENVDFQNDYGNRFKDADYDPLDIEGNMQKIKQLNLERQSTIMPKDLSSEHHYMKTQKNIQRFILAYFYQGMLNPNQRLSSKISIKQIKSNEKKTLMHIFWAFQSKQEVNEDEIKRTQRFLTRKAGFLSGKMTQVLGLRYGPEIRFYFDRILKQTQQMKNQLYSAQQQIIQFELKSLMDKGHIKTQQDYNLSRMKLQAITNENIGNKNNRNKLMSKKYIKKVKEESESQVKENKKRKIKPNSEQKLWQHINKL